MSDTDFYVSDRAPLDLEISSIASPADAVESPSFNLPLADDLPPEFRARVEAARERKTVSAASVVSVKEIQELITTGHIIAGAHAEKQGALMGWTGRGEVTCATLTACLKAANAPEEWAPESKSLHAYASQAINRVSRAGLIPRTSRASKLESKQVAARWIIGRPNYDGQVGDSMGGISLTVTLSRDGALTTEGDAVIAAEVTSEFQRLRDAEACSAADVTGWLSNVLRRKLSAVRMAQAWYVPHASVNIAESILTEVSKVWGTDWLLPALPIATCKQLQAGLAIGLINEANTVLAKLNAQRIIAATANRTDVGPRAAATLLNELMTVSNRARQYAMILGEEHLAEVQAELSKAVSIVEPLCDTTAQRGAVLEMD